MSTQQPAPVIQQRLRRAIPLALCVYAGIPALFFAAVIGIGVAYARSEDGNPFNWPALIFPFVMAVIAAMAWRGQRTEPASWSQAGVWLGGITAMVSVFYTIVLDTGMLAVLFLPAAVVGALAGLLVGWLASNTLLRPPVPELAETPYPLSYGIRGRKRMALVIGAAELRVLEGVSIRTAQGDETVSRGPSYPLSSVAGVRTVMLSGTEVLRFPETIENGPVSSPGPALVVRTPDHEWVLPLADADVIGQIIVRRAAFAGTAPAAKPWSTGPSTDTA